MGLCEVQDYSDCLSLFKAIFSYWVTSNMFTIGQVAFLRHPAVRRFMGIPEIQVHENLPPPGGFFENMKAGKLY